jgi:hypothetical protein
MAEVITGLIALPALYLIGDFYYRLGAWLWRTLGTGKAGAAATEPMPGDGKYEAALQTALAVLDELATRPDLPRPDKLSTVTYLILNAMHRAEKQQPGWFCCEPSIN